METKQEGSILSMPVLDTNRPYEKVIGLNEEYYVQDGRKYDITGKFIDPSVEVKEENKETKIYKCFVCGKEFTDEYKHIKHMEIHRAVIKYRRKKKKNDVPTN